MVTIGRVIIGVLSAYQLVLFARAILSWIPLLNPGWKPRKLGLLLAETVYTLTDPLLKPLRKLIKPLRVGSMLLDMAFLILFFLVIVGIWITRAVFF
ncbi:MAG: YggT family protein [Propionibacteriaceae bacterium]|jgi:YggT family protein|nr:YggT family protein [Propionibacteriaceae bacterium]